METKKDNYTYVGSTALNFKEQWYNHNHDLEYDAGTGTTLSGKYWELIKAQPTDPAPKIKWKIANRCHPLKAGMRACDVCTTEKCRILLQHGVPEPKASKDHNIPEPKDQV